MGTPLHRSGIYQVSHDQPPLTYQLSANAVIQAVNGRVLVFHDFGEDVLDSTGKLLFTIDNVAGPMAVDAGGHMYGVAAGKSGIPLNNSTDSWTGSTRTS